MGWLVSHFAYQNQVFKKPRAQLLVSGPLTPPQAKDTRTFLGFVVPSKTVVHPTREQMGKVLWAWKVLEPQASYCPTWLSDFSGSPHCLAAGKATRGLDIAGRRQPVLRCE